MDRYILKFDVENAQYGPLRWETYHDVSYIRWTGMRNYFAKECGLTEIGGSFQVEVPSEQFSAILKYVEKWTNSGIAHFGFGRLIPFHDRSETKDENNNCWYGIMRGRQLVSSVHDCENYHMLACKACNMMPESHIRWAFNSENWYRKYPHSEWPSLNCVSEDFVNCVRENGLTGLDFIGIPDIGRYSERQWYYAIPSVAIGRGLDHPWVDPILHYKRNKDIADFEKYDRDSSMISKLIERLKLIRTGYKSSIIPPCKRFGIYEFEIDCRKKEIDFNPSILERLVDIYDTERVRNLGRDPSYPGLSVSGEPCVLKDYLPSVDFAYYGDESDIYISPRAFKVMVNREIITNHELNHKNIKKVMVCDCLPDDRECLDILGPPPLPMHYREENTRNLRDNAVVMSNRQAKHPRPELEFDFNRTLKDFENLKRKDRFDYIKDGIGDKQIQEIEENNDVKIPEYWKRILKISADYSFSNTDFISVLPSRDVTIQFIESYIESNGEEPPSSWLVVGYASCGDAWILALDEFEKSFDDCRVKQISHEGYYIYCEWRSIPHFLDDAIKSELEEDNG